MITTSKDLLNIVLALSVSLLTIFFIWLVYYVIAIIRDVREVISSIKDKAMKVDDLINNISCKIRQTSFQFATLLEIIKKGSSLFYAWKEKKDTKKSTKSRRTNNNSDED